MVSPKVGELTQISRKTHINTRSPNTQELEVENTNVQAGVLDVDAILSLELVSPISF